MSIEIMTEVWAHTGLSPTEKLVFLDIANHADQERFCWPGLARLAERAGLQERAVSRIVKKLEDAGYLAVDRSHASKRSNTYRILPTGDWPESVVEDTPVVSDIPVIEYPPRGIETYPPPCIQRTPESSLNPHRIKTDSLVSTQENRPPPAKVTERATQNAARAEVAQHFVAKTNLQCPPSMNNPSKAKMWWNPIREICELAHWDVGLAKRIVDDALKELTGLTVSDPNSILKTARSVAAKMPQKPTRQKIKVRDPETGQIIEREAMI